MKLPTTAVALKHADVVLRASLFPYLKEKQSANIFYGFFYEVESRHQHPGNNEKEEDEGEEEEEEHVFWFAEVFSTCSPAEELLLEVWDPSAAASATGFTTVSLGSGAAS